MIVLRTHARAESFLRELGLFVSSNCFVGILPIKLVRASLKPKAASGFRFLWPTPVSFAFSRQLYNKKYNNQDLYMGTALVVLDLDLDL